MSWPASLLLLVSLLWAPLAALAQSVPQPDPLPAAAPLPGTGTKVHAADAAPTGPAALFAEKCAMCHGKMGMGTGLLGRRVHPAELLQRDNLQPVYVIQAVRMGIGNMPQISRGEVSDMQLKTIAEWLALPPAHRKS